MKKDMDINAQGYWDRRFQEDWEAFAGPRQSRFFASLAIENLPSWIFTEVRRSGLSVADWGCAQGDGTELIASCVGSSHVTGIDFAETAIAQARERYPNVRFEQLDWLREGEEGTRDYDIVFSSNTLEHFHEPLDVLERIACHASKAVLLAVPYRELDRHEEHFVSFVAQNVPLALRNGYHLAWAKAVDCAEIPDTAWQGEQLFLAYVNPQWLHTLGLSLMDCHIDPKATEPTMGAGEIPRFHDLMRLNEQLQLRVAEAAELREQVRQRDAVNRELQSRADALAAELAQKRQEMDKLSGWAQSISSHPMRYAVKRSLYLTARGIYRALPLSPARKLVLRNYVGRGVRYARRILRGQPNVPTRPLRLTDKRIELHRGERDVFVFAVIDWHFRIQRPQHLARSMAQAGRRVFFISNVFVDAAKPGYRIERLDPALPLYQVNLHVPGAPAIYFAAPSAETIAALQASVALLMAEQGALSSVSLVQHAFWYPLVKTLPNNLHLYDCMDHHEGFGNVPAELVALEKEMLRASDLVVVTSTWLEKFAGEYNRHVATVRNAVEYEFFSQRPEKVYQDAQGRRIIGYFGAIAEWFDIALVRSIAQAHPDCLVLLVGNDTVKAGAQLGNLPNVVFTGEVPYRELPFYLYAFDVCLLPFQVTQLTLATNPVKVYEYLAAGKPVVCVDLPEIGQFGELVRKAADAKGFVAQIGSALAEPVRPEAVAARQSFAAQQTWRHRAEQLGTALAALQMPKVSVIVLTYNNLELTKRCLASLVEESDYPALEIVIVDNASSDGSPDYLREFAAAHPGVKLILNDKNLGFAAGNNVGLAAATGEYLAILNNDTVVTRGWVLTLLRHLEADATIGLVGPITNNIGNAAKVATSYTDLADMPSEAFNITLTRPGRHFPLRTAAFFCVMMPRTAYERCGPMAEEYGLGFFEDDDYCRRMEQAGLRVVCAEDAFVHHHLSASFGKLPSAERIALFERNKATYEQKWGAWQPHSYERPPAQSGQGRVAGEEFVAGRCTVCGRATRFFFTDRALWRESLTCEHCLSTSRYRSIARGVLRAIEDVAGVKSDALATLPHAAGGRRLKAYDTQPPFYWIPCAYPVPDLLKKTGWIDVALSQYKPDRPMGEALAPGITNQNLERLTYESESLDIVITSDVMEHVRLDDLAHQEIHRVLRPGGVYLFTVPHDMQRDDTLVRVRVDDPANAASDVMVMEPEYHGDTNGDGSGVLAYRLYGRSLVQHLEELGFEVQYSKEDRPGEGILNTELFYCRKVAR
jgi:GT2 family glycosyltransferase/SAM-dependent methyltransferase/glycosyltransferase involved in cell wall biosynthesis